MKKRFAAAVLVFVLAVQTLVTCIAANSGIKVVLEGKTLDFDVPPIIQEGRTLVPMRAIFEKLGYTVEWDAENRAIKATDDRNTINMYIDFYTFWKNGEALPTDVAPCIIDGRTLVPVRVISEASGCSVQWNEVTKTVFIGKPDLSGIAITATPDPTPTPSLTPSPTPDDLTLDTYKLTLKEDQSHKFETTRKVWLEDEKIVWKSSDYRIATVSTKGTVTGLSAGECVITATAGDVTVSCDVTVEHVPERPELEVIGYNTSKLFVDNRNYLTITISNHGELPVTIGGTGKYTYLTGAEGIAHSITNDSMYDIYTMELSAPETVIKPKAYQLITFTKKGDPTIGGQTLKENFEESFVFQFDYDEQKYTATKLKAEKKKDDSSEKKKDFTY